MKHLHFKIFIFTLFAMGIVLGGCSSGKTVYITSDKDSKAMVTMGIDYRDFEATATKAVDSMLMSNALYNSDGRRYVLLIGRFINDTTQRIDMDQLIKKIRVALLRSGKVIVTTAVGYNGPEDIMSRRVRALRKDDEFNQKTIAKKGQLISADLSLSGKIIQRAASISRSKQRVDYYFQLTLTDLDTGLAYWEDETVISKAGDNNTVTW